MRIDQLYPTAQTIVITDGLGEQTGIKLSVVGPDSKQYRDAAKKAAKVLMGKDAKSDFDLMEKCDAEILAACITGWEGIENADGPVPYTYAKALELMLVPELTFMREQVEAAVAERARFFRKGEQPA